jgi:hypothetical protein
MLRCNGLSGLSSNPLNLPQSADRIESYGVGKLQEFDDINAPLPALNPGDEGLVAPQALSEVGLREAGLDALLDEQRPKPLVAGRLQRLRHGG